MGRLIIDGGRVYELDEACMRDKNWKRQRDAQVEGISDNRGEKEQKRADSPPSGKQ